MVLAEGGRVVLIGSALGFAGLVVVAKLVGSLLFGVSLFEPFVILGTAVVCLASTVMACAIPAYPRCASGPCHIPPGAMNSSAHCDCRVGSPARAVADRDAMNACTERPVKRRLRRNGAN